MAGCSALRPGGGSKFKKPDLGMKAVGGRGRAAKLDGAPGEGVSVRTQEEAGLPAELAGEEDDDEEEEEALGTGRGGSSARRASIRKFWDFSMAFCIVRPRSQDRGLFWRSAAAGRPLRRSATCVRCCLPRGTVGATARRAWPTGTNLLLGGRLCGAGRVCAGGGAGACKAPRSPAHTCPPASPLAVVSALLQLLLLLPLLLAPISLASRRGDCSKISSPPGHHRLPFPLFPPTLRCTIQTRPDQAQGKEEELAPFFRALLLLPAWRGLAFGIPGSEATCRALASCHCLWWPPPFVVAPSSLAVVLYSHPREGLACSLTACLLLSPCRNCFREMHWASNLPPGA